MPCTTILVGKKASYDGSTIIARTDDGFFDVKKYIIVNPKDQPRLYKSKISHLKIELPDNPYRYSASPSVSKDKGVWAAQGINEKNVGMSATETTTSNALVLGADPLVFYKKANGKEKEVLGGIGEEDIVVLVLPYINSAREGVIRLGQLLEKYGTYESNGIAFHDEKEIWWFESIGGHHFAAKKIKDEEYVIAPNQFGMDKYDLEDGVNEQKEHICSKDLIEFINKNHLDCNNTKDISLRKVFGSHSHSDHVYNTPRAWYMGRYFNPTTYKWNGENAEFTPISDNIPFTLVPEKKITIEEIKFILSSYYQDTIYNPFQKADLPTKGIYRPIGISRTGVTTINQIRPYIKGNNKSIAWVCFGSNAFNCTLPVYTNVSYMPKYISSTELKVDSNTFYWASRIIDALADSNYGSCIQFIERYQSGAFNIGHKLLNKYDGLYNNDEKLLEKANEEIAKEIRKLTEKTLDQVLLEASKNMKVSYSRADN